MRRGAAQSARMAFGICARVGADDDPGQPAERRQGRSFPLRNLAFVEGGRIAGHDRLHDGMVRLVGLQQSDALPPCAAGPAGHLAEQLEGPFGGARIAIGEPEIGIDHADQRHVRKIVTLGDELRADDDVRLALGHCLELQPHPFHAAENVGGQHDGAGIGKVAGHLLGDSLHAGAAGDEVIEGAAFGTGIRPLLVMAAMMADELAAKPVLHQPARALRALEAMAAGTA